MTMASYVVYLKNNSFLVVPEAWIQNPVLGIVSKVYFSNNLADAPDFDLKAKFYINVFVAGCYEAFVYKKFGEFNFV